MNDQRIYLEIPKPCGEDWDKMAPGANGRFCSNCQKTVIDFTGYTDTEVANYFKTAKPGLCGRFLEEQLGAEQQPASHRRSIPFINRIAAGLFIFTLPFSADLKAFPKAPYCYVSHHTDKDTNKTKLETAVITINGTVKTPSGHPLRNVEVRHKDQVAFTDAEGNFSLVIPDQRRKKIKIDFIYRYEIKRYYCYKKQTARPFHVEFTPNTISGCPKF